MEDRLSGRPPRTGAADNHDAGVALGGLIALLAITAAWWALALWPAAETPTWLARTRYVCFGIGDTGLPDAGGWIGLIGGPLGMLAVFAVGWAREIGALLCRARSSAAIAATLALLALGATMLPVGATLRVRAAADPRATDLAGVPAPATDFRRTDRAAPPLALVAHDGAVRSLEALRGRPVLVTFAYGHCETVCPLVVRDVVGAREILLADRVPADRVPAILIVTLDPWRDTPSQLAAMAAAWRVGDGEAWVLGGDVASVQATLDAWRVPRSRNMTDGEITHPSLVYVIDAEGRIAFAASGGPKALANLIRRL